MIYDLLCTDTPMFKYINDTTIYDISQDLQSSTVQPAMDTIVTWSENNTMSIIETKTKEMFISFHKDPPEVPMVVVNGIPLERV